jgi:hypothetical protein
MSKSLYWQVTIKKKKKKKKKRELSKVVEGCQRLAMAKQQTKLQKGYVSYGDDDNGKLGGFISKPSTDLGLTMANSVALVQCLIRVLSRDLTPILA